jgi:hypothetical protein
MVIKNALKNIDLQAKKAQPLVDKMVGFCAVNTLATYTAIESISSLSPTQTTKDLALMGAGAVIAFGNYAMISSPKTKKIRQLTKRANDSILEKRPLAWIKTGVLALGLTAGILAYTPNTISTITTTHQTTNTFELSDMVVSTPTQITARPTMYDSLSYTCLHEPEFSNISLANKYSLNGRIQRTLRWENIYQSVEQKHNLPKNLIGAMIMQESCGDPLQPNATNDGGLGLSHIQGTTGRNYGLRIYGDSHTDSDFAHGNSLAQLLKDNNYDFSKIHEHDDRAHPIKNLDAAARIVVDGIQRYGEVRRGVRYYRGGSDNAKTKYWDAVKTWQNALNNPAIVSQAIDDFNQRNTDITYAQYKEEFRKANFNWDLNKYRTSSFD